jgi:L-threonylcarbamoyladenylate synthase
LEEVRRIAPETTVAGSAGQEDAPRAPGMKYRHYAPDADVVLLQGDLEQQLAFIEKSGLYQEPFALMACQEMIDVWTGRKSELELTLYSLGSRYQDKTLGKNVYAYLREADQAGIRTVFVESFKEENMGRTIMNRLKKAAHAGKESL